MIHIYFYLFHFHCDLCRTNAPLFNASIKSHVLAQHFLSYCVLPVLGK